MISFENMYLVKNAVDNAQIPRFIKVRQHFDVVKEDDVRGAIQREMNERALFGRIKSGQTVAISVGSRQISNLSVIVRELVDICLAKGAHPYIFPSMGSHGGGTEEGQKAFLKQYGITEESMNAPINASMEVVDIGTISDGTHIQVASHLLKADAVIIVNRIKAHPGFSGPIESGLTKMSVIGFGKRLGAESMHRIGTENMSQRLIEASELVFLRVPVIFGVGIIENAYDETAEIHCIPAEAIPSEEPPLLLRAKSYMPRIIPNPLDILIIDEIGKNISGMGADPCITNRFTSPYKSGDYPGPTRMIMRGLTKETEHAASGMGQADIITKRLFDDIDIGKTYVNQITSVFIENDVIPLIMPNDIYAIKTAIKTCRCPDMNNPRIVRIKNTLQIGEIYASEALIQEIETNEMLEIVGEPFTFSFDEEGYFVE
ncbi:MAG: DUF362 domain-containing protein [Lachnospiraceae bacterium]|nr:DUF362 domain-containing protein [Lachnospiraceae bacterium]